MRIIIIRITGLIHGHLSYLQWLHNIFFNFFGEINDNKNNFTKKCYVKMYIKIENDITFFTCSCHFLSWFS